MGSHRQSNHVKSSSGLLPAVLAVTLFVVAAGCVDIVQVADAECSVPSQRVQCGMKSCNPDTHECTPCVVDSDCYEGVLTCNLDNDGGTCEFRPLSETFSFVTLIAPLAGLLVCAVGVVAGVGGGAILVPVYFAVLQFPITAAVALSQATICGQSLVNMYFLIPRRDPNFPSSPPSATRPVINYEFLLLMLPFSLVGTLLGNMGGKIAPDWLRVLLLVIMLGGIMYRLADRIKKLKQQSSNSAAASPTPSPNGGAHNGTAAEFREEAEEMQRQIKALYNALGVANQSPPLDDEELDVLEDVSVVCGDRIAPPFEGSIVKTKNPNVSHQPSREDDSTKPDSDKAAGEVGKPQYPVKLFALTALIFFAQLFLAYIKTPSSGFVACGSAGYFLIVVIAVTWNSSLSLAFRAYLKGLHDRVVEGTLPASAVPFIWSAKTTVIFPAVSVVAGAAASMFGIGGGMILNFLLLEAGISPEATSATGGAATFLVATQAALLFLIQGQLRLDYGIMLFAAGIASTLLGQKVFMVEIRRRKLTYLIVTALLAVMVGSMLSQSIMGIYKTVVIMGVGGPLGLGSLCPK